MKFFLLLAKFIYIVYIESLRVGAKDVAQIITDVPGVGKCMGQRWTNANDEEYTTYSGIPYARIQKKKWFQPSVPPPQTEQVVNPDYYISPCPGWRQTYIENDDEYITCLVLKIFTKNINRKLPVIVYLPGLDLASGDTYTAREDLIMTKDVVFVTIQYRLGPFGFLSTSSNEIPGNIGVLDIIDALKWIQKHISHFGGDPNRVTLNGEYLAAGLIGILTASPLAEGLFHQVIYQSGSKELSNLVTDKPQIYSRKVAYELVCTDVLDTDKITQCLLNAIPRDIRKAFNTLMKESNGMSHPITVGGPSGVYDWNNQQRKYPTLGGFVDHPTVYLEEEKYHQQLENLQQGKWEPPQLLNELYGENVLEKQFNITDELLDTLMETYLPTEIDAAGIEIKMSVVKALFNNMQQGGKSYLYVYKRAPQNPNILGQGSVLMNVVTLGDDLLYLYLDRSFTGSEKYISELLVDLWTSFAITGIPTSRYVDKWPEMVSLNGPYLGINEFAYVGFNVTKEITPLLNCQRTKGCEWINL